MKTETLAVANTIAQQIGHRAFLMMGTRNKLGDANSLVFDVRGSGDVNKVRVSLEPSDTYTVTFYKVRGLHVQTVAAMECVYADGLNQVIESNTGLCLSL